MLTPKSPVRLISSYEYWFTPMAKPMTHGRAQHTLDAPMVMMFGLPASSMLLTRISGQG